MRASDWSGFTALAAFVASVALLVLGRPVWALAFFLLGVAGALLTRYWSTRYPAPMPYALRWTLRVPRGSHSPEHLRRILDPRSGERILEIGPGIGIHALPVATALAPSGELDVFDVQQEMLDDVMRRAGGAGITNIAPRLGGAEALPYADASFDAAYLIGVLGEVPDPRAALHELRRVLKPGGRLVIGEVFFDSDFVRLPVLTELTTRAGFVYERKLGGSQTYLARFRTA
jgi:SAM-dependent methyltransferase